VYTETPKFSEDECLSEFINALFQRCWHWSTHTALVSYLNQLLLRHREASSDGMSVRLLTGGDMLTAPGHDDVDREWEYDEGSPDRLRQFAERVVLLVADFRAKRRS
jgi:hypothetical protein